LICSDYVEAVVAVFVVVLGGLLLLLIIAVGVYEDFGPTRPTGLRPALLFCGKAICSFWSLVSLLQIVRLGFHLAEDPVLLEKLFLSCHVPLELGEVVMVSDVKCKRHGRVDLRIVDLFGCLFVVVHVVLFYLVQVVGHRRQCVVRVQENQIVFLHPYKVVGFLGAASDNAAVELLHEEGLYRVEVFQANFLQAESR